MTIYDHILRGVDGVSIDFSVNKIPRSWAITQLEDVAAINMGQSPPSSTYNVDGDGLPFFQGKAEFGEFYPIPKKWCFEPSKIAQKEDILISVRAPVGPTNLAPSECCIGRGLAAIRPLGDIPNRYLLYYLRSIETEIDSLGTGSTFKAISGKILRSIKIPLAPQAQQTRIVAEIEKQFSRLDEAIANLKRVKANLKRYKAAVLKAAVEGKLTEEWRKQHPDLEPADQLLERILEERRANWQGRGKYKEPVAPDTSGLPGLPEGWVWAQIETVADMMSGHAFKKDEYSEKGIRLFQIANVSFGFTKWVEVEHLPESYTKEWDHLLLKEGDVLMALNRPLLSKELKIARLGPNDVPAILYQRVGKFLFYEKEIADYFLIFMQSPYYVNALERQLQGVNIPFINKGVLLNTPMPIPQSLREMKAIVAEVERRLSIIAGAEAQVEANLRRADRLRQSILKQAFSGQLVTQDPNDEPASVLLERIQATQATFAKDSKETPSVRRRAKSSTKAKPKTAAADYSTLDSILNAILNLMQLDQEYSRSDLADALGLSTARWNMAIQELKRRGQVRKSGARRGATYSVVINR